MNFSISKRAFATVSAVTALSLFSVGCGSGDSRRNMNIPGVDGPTVTLNADTIDISMTVENLSLDGGFRYPIPKYPNSSIEIAPDFQSGGTLLSFSIDLDDVFSGNAAQLDPLSLPGGRALPGVATGTLPAVAMTIEKFKNVSIYLGPKVFGVFVPVKGMNLQGAILTFRHYVSNSRVGNVSIIGEDVDGENSGVLLMLDLGKYKSRLKRVAKRVK